MKLSLKKKPLSKKGKQGNPKAKEIPTILMNDLYHSENEIFILKLR